VFLCAHRAASLRNNEGNLVRLRADVVYDDAGALAPEALGNGPADTAPGPGHDHDSSDEASLLLHGLLIE
jgi:hypothetical protein